MPGGSVMLTPVDLSAATKVGPRLYRKQLLRKVAIDYPAPDGTKQRVNFDDAYLAELAASFNAGAYDLAPFILADESNRHTLAPERYRGELKAVEVTPDGLDGILELSEDAAELVERTGRRLGVSARIKSAVEHVDGRKFGRAIHHVLGTLDGRMQGPTHGLKPWEPIDLSDDDPTVTVLDLSGFRYQEDAMPRLSLDHLTDDDLLALSELAQDAGIDLSAADDGADDEPDGGDLEDDAADGADGEGDDAPDDQGDGEDGDGEDGEGDDGEGDDAGAGITDDELDALIDAELETMGIAPPGGDVSLSAADDGPDAMDDVDLSADPEVDEAAQLRAELARREYVGAGVPPFCVDLAVPVLALKADDDTLDLASPVDGSAVDVRTIVTSLLDALKGTVDLAREDGYGHDTGGVPQQTAAEKAWLQHMQAEGLTS